MSRRAGAIVLALLTVSLLGVGSPQASLIQNGGFETISGTVTPGWYLTLPAGAPSLTGWTIGGGGIDVVHTGYWNAAGGSYSIDLNGSAGETAEGGILWQSFKTVAGQNYSITLNYAASPGYASQAATLSVISAGDAKELALLKLDANTSRYPEIKMTWIEATFAFTAETDWTTLELKSLTTGNSGLAFDNIRVVPIPGAAWLLGAGLIGVVAVRRAGRK